ncbi:hypothetical protein HKD37_13G036200 [Glycine soja]
MRSTAVVNPSRFCRLQWRAQSTIVVQPSESGRASTGPHDLDSEEEFITVPGLSRSELKSFIL